MPLRLATERCRFGHGKKGNWRLQVFVAWRIRATTNAVGMVKRASCAFLSQRSRGRFIKAALPVSDGALGATRPATITFKAPIGAMAFELASDGTFTLKNGAYEMVVALP